MFAENPQKLGLPSFCGHRVQGFLVGRMFIVGTRRKYSPEFRCEAAGLVIDTGRQVVVVAKELGVDHSVLSRWVKRERARRVEAGQEGKAEKSVAELEAEIARLRKELADVRLDAEFLGKAAAFFASKPLR